MGNSPSKSDQFHRATYHHVVHRTQCNVASCSEAIDDFGTRSRNQELNEPPPSYDVSINQRIYSPSAPHFPSNNNGSNTLYPNLHDSNIRNSNPITTNVPQNSMESITSQTPLASNNPPYLNYPEKPPVTCFKTCELDKNMIDIQYLLNLSTKEKSDVISEMILQKNSFVKLFKEHVETSLMLILMKLVKKVCLSDILDKKMEILKFVCSNNFFHCLGDYISNLPTHGQDTAQEDRLFLEETVVPFLECVFTLIHQDIRIELRDLVIKTSLSIQGMEQYRRVEIADNSKQRVQKIASELQCDVKMVLGLKDTLSGNREELQENSFSPNDSVKCDSQYPFKTKLNTSGKERKEIEDLQQEGMPLEGVLRKNMVPSKPPSKYVFQFPSENKIMTEGNVREDSLPDGQSKFQGVFKKNRCRSKNSVKHTLQYPPENDVQMSTMEDMIQTQFSRVIVEDTQLEKEPQKGNKNIPFALFDESVPSKPSENYSYELKALSAFKSKKVRGMHKSLFFIDKIFKKENYKYGEFLIALAYYLIKQQYDVKNILLLSADEDDLQNTLRMKKKHKSLENISSKLLTDTGSWSCSIALISFSLKSSGATKCILDNHIIRKVAVEAREGFFMIGNMLYLQKLHSFWSTLNVFLQDNELISPRITLCCQTHGAISVINDVKEFNPHQNGGCKMDCDMKLDCGHSCVRRCHTDDINHERYFCHKPCNRKPENCTRNHRCRRFCFEKCGPCPDVVDLFGQSIMCHSLSQTNTDVYGEYSNTYDEDNQSTKSADTYQNISSHPLNTKKRLKDNKLLPCGHNAATTFLPPFKKLNKWSLELVNLCNQPCSATLECGHSCTGTCGECRQGKVHVLCPNTRKLRLACGHRLVTECRVVAANCNQRCYYQCSHSSCRNRCGERCTPCNKPCVRGCEHGRCTKRCSERCNWPPCFKPCKKFLSCGHKCIGFCGEPCPAGPDNCRQCNADKFKKWDMSGKARFVVLEDCKHVVRGYDLDNKAFAEHRKVEVLTCPICGFSIFKTGRYLNYTREILHALFLIKHQYDEYCKEVPDKFWNIVQEIKQYSFPQEVEVFPPFQQLKEYTRIAASSGLIDEKSLLLLQFCRNVLCSMGTAPYRPLLWILTLFLEYYENGFSNQVLKELYGLVVEQQTLNRDVDKQKLLDLHLALSYYHSIERGTWVLCPKNHVSTSGSLLTLCNRCD